MSIVEAPFGVALSEALEARGLTALELADRCGLSYATLRRYLNGERRPKAGAIARVARALELSPFEADELRLAAGFAPTEHPALGRLRSALALAEAAANPRADAAIAMVEAARLYLEAGP